MARMPILVLRFGVVKNSHGFSPLPRMLRKR